VGLFGALSDEILEHLCNTLKPHRVPAGEAVFREGDPAREMYVLLDGEMEVIKRSRRGRDQRVALLGPNDCFGEMSIVDMQVRSATVRAVAPSRILRISTEDMDALYRHDLKSYTLIVLNIARDLSRRLRVTDGILADFTASVLDEYVVGSKQPPA
jgi:CRP-like cAMP-binding protein